MSSTYINLPALTLTGGTTVTGSVNVLNFPVSQTINGTIAVSNFPSTFIVNQGTSPWIISGAVTGPLTDTQLRASPVSVSGTFFQSIQPVSQSGVWTAGRTWTLDSSTDSVAISNFPSTFTVTQGTSPWVVSGTVTANAGSGTFAISAVSLPLPTGASTSALQTTGNASLSSIDSKLTSPLAVTGPLTDAQLRAAAVPVSGTVVATQGTAPWVVSGTVAATQSGAWSIGRTWTLASGADSVSVVQSTSPWVVSGTVTTGGLTDAQLRATPVPVSGTVTASNASVSTTGTAVPASATMIGGSDGTNLRAVKVSTTGVVSVDGSAVTQPISVVSLPLPTGAATSAKQPTLGTAGTASADVITVQGIASMTALKVDGSATTQPISGTVTANAGTNLNTSLLALDTSVNGIIVTQGSTTSGEKGPLIQGAVTTSNPTYTTAQTSPLSLNTSGELRTTNAASRGTLTDGSGNTSGTPNTFTTVFASNANRKYLLVQNTDVSGNTIVIDFGASPSTTKGIVLVSLGSFVMEGSYISTEQINVIAPFNASITYCAKQG